MSAANRPARVEVGALLALAGFTLVAVAGYWNFALHPERLEGVPGAIEFYGRSFPLFARLHIAVSALVLGLVLVRRLGGRWLPAFGAVLVLSFLSEHVGTGYGIPFGGYGYTGMLGPKLGGRVPYLIPLSWFLMALPSWLLARAALPAPSATLGRVALGALWLTVWDLALDPAMSHLTSYWIWQESGPYYGMPWLNLAGWYVTGLVLMAALSVTLRGVDLDRVPVGWTAAYYATVVAMPLGMLVAAEAWLAVGVSGVALGGLAFGSRRLAAEGDGPASEASIPAPAPAPAEAR